MVAFVIFDAETTDQAAMDEYGREAMKTVQAFNGRVVAASSAAEVREGDWRPNRIVILEFPSLDVARAWYESPAYRKVLPLRRGAANVKMLMVEGTS